MRKSTEIVLNGQMFSLFFYLSHFLFVHLHLNWKKSQKIGISDCIVLWVTMTSTYEKSESFNSSNCRNANNVSENKPEQTHTR